jgi:hypothetical protein
LTRKAPLRNADVAHVDKPSIVPMFSAQRIVNARTAEEANASSMMPADSAATGDPSDVEDTEDAPLNDPAPETPDKAAPSVTYQYTDPNAPLKFAEYVEMATKNVKPGQIIEITDANGTKITINGEPLFFGIGGGGSGRA